jgi:predicted nucleic acid-binding protein
MAAQYRLAMADAIIYATAQHARVPLATCDHHFADLPGVTYYPKSGS